MKKKVRNNLTVLERQLQELYETHKVKIPDVASPYIREAMKSFAVQAIQEHNRNKRREMVKTLKYLPKPLFLGYSYFIILFLRKIMYKMAVRQAHLRADTENYKIYVVLATKLTYKLISTLDFKHNKKLRIFKKDVFSKDMEREAAYIAFPKKIRVE